METTIKIAHPVLVLILIAGYAFLIYRFRKSSSEHMQPIEITIAQVVRFALLLVYFTGLFMSVNYRMFVSKTHHYASLAPVLVLAVFQFLPIIRRKEHQPVEYFYFFSALLVTVAVISLTARL
jgi:hypothetical protein